MFSLSIRLFCSNEKIDIQIDQWQRRNLKVCNDKEEIKNLLMAKNKSKIFLEQRRNINWARTEKKFKLTKAFANNKEDLNSNWPMTKKTQKNGQWKSRNPNWLMKKQKSKLTNEKAEIQIDQWKSRNPNWPMTKKKSKLTNN